MTDSQMEWIPCLDARDALVHWEAFQATVERRVLADLVGRVRSDSADQVIAASEEFNRHMLSVADKVHAYGDSVRAIAGQHDLEVPGNLDQLDDFASRLDRRGKAALPCGDAEGLHGARHAVLPGAGIHVGARRAHGANARRFYPTLHGHRASADAGNETGARRISEARAAGGPMVPDTQSYGARWLRPTLRNRLANWVIRDE